MSLCELSGASGDGSLSLSQAQALSYPAPSEETLKAKAARLLLLPCPFLLQQDLPGPRLFPDTSQQKSVSPNDLSLLIVDKQLKI